MEMIEEEASDKWVSYSEMNKSTYTFMITGI